MIKTIARSCFPLLMACGGLLWGAPSAFAQVKKDSTEIQEDIRSNIPVIVLDDNDAENNASSSGQTISSILYGGRDPFYSGVFNFNAARFRLRGYDASYFDTYINGAPVKNLTNGYTAWNLWGGLNDVMRSRITSNGLRPVDYAYGDIGGTNYIDTRASSQRKGVNVNYALSNRNYNHRLMASWNTGLMKNGWAVSFAGSLRYADQGYVKGTFYNGASYFLSVDKKINEHHLLSFTTFGTPTQNGVQTAAVAEMYDLAGSNYYNPSWGYQEGKVRSANYNTTFQPYFILNHEWTINTKSRLNTAVSYVFGNRTRTSLDWYNAPDPRPDYYRNLPSYATDPIVKFQLDSLFRNDERYRQVNWNNMYDVNRNSYATADGVTGRRSRYILQDRVNHTDKGNIYAVYNAVLDKHAIFTGGALYNIQRDRDFQRINDLLGGDFYLNVNQFAERDFPNDPSVTPFNLDDTSRIRREGDKYGYDYSLNVREARAFAQVQLNYNHVDFFLSGSFSTTSMWREGYVRSGLFPNSSKGKSETFTFNNYSLKGGVTYKIDGRNYLFANASYGTRAPFIENVFISPRSRNTAQQNVRSESVFNAEAGYVLNWEKLKLRLNAYYAQFRNGMEVLSYYDDSYQNFVNYALSNIGKEHMGIEMGFEVPVYQGLSVKGAASIGRYYYDTRQEAVVTVDNSATIVANETVYSNNFRVGQTPQEAYTAGISYQSKSYWFANLNWNYFDQLWVNMNPVRRTERATAGVKPGSDEWYNIINQQKIGGQSTVDFYGGKTFRIKAGKKPATLVFTAGVNNILNNRSMATNGFEQLRFDYADNNPSKFPAKYYYAYGINYFISLGIKL